MDRPLYPFTAVVGQERAKQALLCLAVEPRIGGVLPVSYTHLDVYKRQPLL